MRNYRMELVIAALICAALALTNQAARAAAPDLAAARGFRLLLDKEFLPPDFDQQTFDQVWQTWEEPLRSQAEKASPDERRKLAFSRYGLLERPGDAQHRPLQYVVNDRGEWTMNCLACHQGKVAGKIIPGAPNTLLALQTLTEEIRETKLRLHKPLTRMDLGSMFIPLGGSNGTSNAVMFGVVLLAYRDADLNFHRENSLPSLANHDHDAPAWWNFHKKDTLYADGFARKDARPLMQMLLVKENGPEKFRQWEGDFNDIYAWLESLRPPAYPWRIDRELAARGEKVFVTHCADCHGTYGASGKYPNKIVPIAEVGTDRVRLDALTPKHRERYGNSWFTHYGQEKIVADPGGYVAPPLDGIWASAPYFHNGSVPTLWHVLHPDQRPKVWLRTEDGYDTARVGLEFTAFDQLPEAALASTKQRRRYFDTSGLGKSAAGHLFPNDLTEPEKNAVLEYLKTL